MFWYVLASFGIISHLLASFGLFWHVLDRFDSQSSPARLSQSGGGLEIAGFRDLTVHGTRQWCYFCFLVFGSVQ
jgi:hypothetical protein